MIKKVNVLIITLILVSVLGACLRGINKRNKLFKLSLPSKKAVGISEITVSPNMKYIGYVATDKFDDDKDRYQIAVVNIANKKNNLILDEKIKPDFWVRKFAWSRFDDLLITGEVEKNGHKTSYAYLYNAKRNILKLLSSSNIDNRRNKYNFLINGGFHNVYIYSSTKYLIAGSGLGAPGEKNYLFDTSTNKKKIIPFNINKETSGFINNVIFSKDGSLIIFEAKPRYWEHDSKGLWLYSPKQNRLEKLPKTEAKMKTVFPLAISDNKRMLLYYIASSNFDDGGIEKKRPLLLYDIKKRVSVKTKILLKYSEISSVQWIDDGINFCAFSNDSLFKYNIDDVVSK